MRNHFNANGLIKIFRGILRLEIWPELRTVPNLISISRFFCLPPLVFCLLRLNDHYFYRYGALLVIFAGGISDILDGHLSRKRNASTLFGTYLDSIADKLLFLPACFLLSREWIMIEPKFPVWLFVIVIGKDLILNSFAAIMMLIMFGKRFRPSVYGKISTFLLVSTIIAVLIGDLIPAKFLSCACWLTAVFTVISMVHYLYIGLKPPIIVLKPGIRRKSYR